VIAIIGILASVVLSSLNSARAKARDAKRRSDISNIQKVLALYYDDFGAYPQSGGAVSPNSGWSNSSNLSSWSHLEVDLLPYMSKLPLDPVNTSDLTSWAQSSGGYMYSYFGYQNSYGCKSWYMLVYRLESTPNPQSPGAKICNNTSFTNPGTNIIRYGGGSITVGDNGSGTAS
jgi:type II secretory pathway pseudopilin PulG